MQFSPSLRSTRPPGDLESGRLRLLSTRRGDRARSSRTGLRTSTRTNSNTHVSRPRTLNTAEGVWILCGDAKTIGMLPTGEEASPWTRPTIGMRRLAYMTRRASRLARMRLELDERR